MRLFLGVLAAISVSGATVDGLNVHWASAGKGKTTVVLVHGWTADSSTWRHQVPVLAKKYRVITLDLPGHGQSEAPKDGKYSMDLFARAVDSVRRDAKVKRCVLVGHSMGAPVIRQYARLYPESTIALVVVDGVVAKPENAGVYAGLARNFSGPNGHQAREQFIKTLLTPAATGFESEVLKMTMDTPDSNAVGAMLAMSDPAIWKVEPISVPVLGIYADHSRLADRELLKQVFPTMDYEEIPGTDHFLMLEKPDEFNRLLLAFLAKQK